MYSSVNNDWIYIVHPGTPNFKQNRNGLINIPKEYKKKVKYLVIAIEIKKELIAVTLPERWLMIYK